MLANEIQKLLKKFIPLYKTKFDIKKIKYKTISNPICFLIFIYFTF